MQIGRIIVSGGLDREMTSEYVVVVVARDSAEGSETTLEVSAMCLGRGKG
jgi:hypothetical protein